MRFFRRFEIWLPTIWGCIAILLLVAIACIVLVRNIYSFLAPNEPIGARVLVIEGWLAPAELDQAIWIIEKGRYDRVITTGGPVLGWPELALRTSYAQMAAAYLAKHGVPNDRITIVSAPASAQERTFLSAVVFRKWMRNSGVSIDAIDLFSAGAHARRSRLLFRMALEPEVRVGIISAQPVEFDPERWWRTTRGSFSVGVQLLGLIWAKCMFWPAPRNSPEELWAAPSLYIEAVR